MEDMTKKTADTAEIPAEGAATAEQAQEAPAKEEKKKDKKQKAELAECRAQLEACQKELEETKDKYLRTMAEYDNFRRRSQKEKEGVYTDAVSDCINEILPLIDNLERAAAAEGDAAKVQEGLQMTAKSTDALLAKLGVEAFGAAGDRFDPEIHNAVMHVEDESLGENVIVDVFQKGYRRGDHIIRYAMVRVAN